MRCSTLYTDGQRSLAIGANHMTKRKPKRTAAINVRISPAELGSLQQAARAADRDWPDWVRRTLKQAAGKGKP